MIVVAAALALPMVAACACACPAPLDPPAPNVLTHDLQGLAVYAPIGGMRSCSVGAVWCNVGDEPAPWSAITASHPVTATNLLRVEDGALRHLGASWAWHHATCPLQSAACGTCVPEAGGCPEALGSGCSTSSSAATLGAQNLLGQRSAVNAATGDAAFPIAAPPVTDSNSRRCAYETAQVNPAQHPTATFAVQTVTVAPGADPSSRSATRPISGMALAAGAGAFLGPTVPGTSAVDVWKSVEPTVEIAVIDMPNDGRVLVASRVAPSGGGYRYDYAIENLSSHESVGAFDVPGTQIAPASPVFAAPLAHSGEVTSNEPWSAVIDVDSLLWSTEPFASNESANAVRWGTTYSFAFESTLPPAPRAATVISFRSEQPYPVTVLAPRAAADLNADGAVGSEDLGLLLGEWGRCAGCASDLNGDGFVNSADLGILLGAWE